MTRPLPEADLPFDGPAPLSPRRAWESPRRRLLLTAAAVFLAQMLVAFVISSFPALPPFVTALVDGVSITALLAPVLYLVLVRPLRERIDELHRTREALGRGRENYRSLIDSTEDSIYLVDADCRYRFVNRHHAARLGRPASALVGMSYADLHPPEKSAKFARLIAAVVREGTSNREEYWSRRDERHFLRTFSPVLGAQGETVAVTVVSKDITDLKRLEQRLQELSTTDELTGLQNRRGFETLATHRLKVAGRQGVEATVLYADLDNLKQVNDAFGHLAGDQAIRDTARLLLESCRESDIVARLGGDEFVILLTGSASEGVQRLIARIQEAMARHNEQAAEGQRLAVSIGYATCPPGEVCTVSTLLSRADRAMYDAKARRKAGPEGRASATAADR